MDEKLQTEPTFPKRRRLVKCAQMGRDERANATMKSNLKVLHIKLMYTVISYNTCLDKLKLHENYIHNTSLDL